jgi:membrane-bound ClpP family serine protease
MMDHGRAGRRLAPSRAIVRTLLLSIFFLACQSVRGDEPAERGIFVTVGNPITSEVVNGIKERLALVQRETPVAKFVFDFNPDGREASSVDYGPCLDLADAIAELNGKTIAFVHGPTMRHTVLPVLACQELVMSSAAALGPVVPDKEPPLNDLKRAVYERVAGKSREALVAKMIDRSVEVLAGRLPPPNGAVTYFDARKRAQAEREGVVGITAQPVLPAGATGKLTADEALRFGLAIAKVDSKQEVAERFRLTATSLREDPLQGRAPDAWLIKVQGTIDRSAAETLHRRMLRALRQGANTLIFELDAAGGDFVVAGDLAKELGGLTGPDGRPVVTVAFVRSAPDTAVFLAAACTDIVMAKNAVLGQFKQLAAPPADPRGFGPRRNPGWAPPEPVNLGAIGDALEKIAAGHIYPYPPLIFRAMTDPSVEVWRVVSQKGSSERRFVTKEELEADQAGDKKWGQPALVKRAGQYLELTAEMAKDYGIAFAVVNNPDDVHELASIYGASYVREPPADWLDKIAGFLSEPVVAMFLVILGVTCLILELKMPGVGVPGVIAAVCFVLFFWSQTQMNGQMTLLAVLLFLLGLVLIGIEIFLLPGFGVTGISGILLVLAGLGLATVEHLPQTGPEWARFGGTMMQFGLGLVVSTVAAVLVARYLPHIPYANRLVLSPPGEKPGDENITAASGTQESLVALLGAVGTAATAMRPAGMALFGESYVDVVSEGSYIPAGARVQVIEIEGNRVVVKEV